MEFAQGGMVGGSPGGLGSSIHRLDWTGAGAGLKLGWSWTGLDEYAGVTRS